MKLKLLLASLLAATSFGASAADQFDIPLTLGVAKTFTGLATPGNGLLSDGSDTLTFTGLRAGAYSVLLSYSGVLVDITTATLNNDPANVLSFHSTFGSSGIFHLTENSPFTLKLSGLVTNFPGLSPSYNGQITVTAIPEPASYGMLLGGLGLMGFIARRKASKQG